MVGERAGLGRTEALEATRRITGVIEMRSWIGATSMRPLCLIVLSPWCVGGGCVCGVYQRSRGFGSMAVWVDEEERVDDGV